MGTGPKRRQITRSGYGTSEAHSITIEAYRPLIGNSADKVGLLQGVIRSFLQRNNVALLSEIPLDDLRLPLFPLRTLAEIREDSPGMSNIATANRWMKTRINRSLHANNILEDVSPTSAALSPSTLGGLAARFIFKKYPLPGEQQALFDAVDARFGTDASGRVLPENRPQLEICRFGNMDEPLVAGLANDLNSLAGSLSLSLGPVEIHTNQPQM